MFQCKICLEKDKRILDLKDEISHIRNVLNPVRPTQSLRYELEQDNLLSGANTETVKAPIDVESELQENLRLQKEQDSLLTGNY